MKLRAAELALLAALLVLAACMGSPYTPSSDDGATIYMEACASCHNGGPRMGPVLAGRALSADQVETRLKRGAAGMPAFPRIRGQARQNLVDFVVRLSRPGDGASAPSSP